MREAGHDTVHLRDEGLIRLPDSDIVAKAVEEHRVVLTFDLDFGDPHTRAQRGAERYHLSLARPNACSRQPAALSRHP